jgi:hypothetical protein
MKTPEQFNTWAQADEERLTSSFYPREYTPDPEANEVFAQGRGPEICMKQGPKAFEEGYKASAIEIWLAIVPFLKDGNRVEVRFHYFIDSKNPWGDTARHLWRVYSKT